MYNIKDRYIKKYQPTLYYLDGGPELSFVFEELQQIQDRQLLVSMLILVPSALSVSSAGVCIYYIRLSLELSIFVSKRRGNLKSSFYL